MKTTMRATLVAAVLYAASASADVTVTAVSGGNDDFFQTCKVSVDVSGSSRPSLVTYHVDVGDKGRGLCQQSARGYSCRATEDMKYSCDDVQAVEVLGVTCRDADGETKACGDITAAADSSLPVPVLARPNGWWLGWWDGSVWIIPGR